MAQLIPRYICTTSLNGCVAQLNSASDFGSEGYRFESYRGHKTVWSVSMEQEAKYSHRKLASLKTHSLTHTFIIAKLHKYLQAISLNFLRPRSQDSLECEYGARGEILTRKTGFPLDSHSCFYKALLFQSIRINI